MTDIFKGVAAALFATGYLTGLLIVQRAFNFFPEVDVIALTNAVLDIARDHLAGWIVYIGVGAVAGGALFAWLEPHLGANTTVKRGVLFGVLAWLAKMIILMPAAGAGLFGLRIGAAAPILLLLMNASYGALLGWLYGVMMPTPALEPRESHGRSV